MNDEHERQRAERAIASLPRTQREIFIAVHFHGLGWPEIATQTGLSQRQIERQLTKALRNLVRSQHRP